MVLSFQFIIFRYVKNAFINFTFNLIFTKLLLNKEMGDAGKFYDNAK